MAANEKRLSQFVARWAHLLKAHGESPATRHAAQGELLPRYRAPVYRYLRDLVQDDTTAEELYQEFAIRFVRGDFGHADAPRGRFRDYLQSALFHFAKEHAVSARGGFRPLAGEVVLTAGGSDSDQDRRFLHHWRSELLNRTWAALEEASKAHGDRFHEVLRMKSDDPSRASTIIAAELTRRHGGEHTAGEVRQTLHRAREKFAELLRAEVAASLPTNDAAQVEAELTELGLLVYCPPTV